MIERDQLANQARVDPPGDLNLAQFHEVLQAAFGWTDSHLHQFIIGGLSFGAPEFDEGYEDDRTAFQAADVLPSVQGGQPLKKSWVRNYRRRSHGSSLRKALIL